MLIDRQSLRDSRGWIVLSLLILLVCTVWYFIYAPRTINGPTGGSLPGLVFGSVGTAIILFAWALTIRKWRRSARWGKTYSWLQGHVYLSIVSYPIILYHAGFAWGGPLTRVLMWAFTICYFSGILVLILQNVMPRLLLQEVTMETVYEEIDHVAQQNLAHADQLVEQHAADAVAIPDLDDDLSGGLAVQKTTTPADLKTFYDQRIRPWLAFDLPAPGTRRGVLSASIGVVASDAAPPAPTTYEFADMRRKLPESLKDVLDTLETYCEERRQFALQKRMHIVLHGWLLLHVPASWVMIVLIPLHAIMAVRYL